ncbi:hypothetical protein C4588_03635 [Candidatus Parcubacteria bacterium]|nr:MAG: hypothetical protein C4588_03635 [Candidatus Parcubacteria bacterium]
MSRKSSSKKVRSLLKDLKTNSSCLDCGLTDPSQLTFDHQLGQVKRFDIASSARFSVELVQKELQKCEVVCIPCHRLRETNRLKDTEFQETKKFLIAIVRVFQVLAVLSGNEDAYREWRDVSKQTEKKRKDRKRYKRSRAQRKNQIKEACSVCNRFACNCNISEIIEDAA